MANQPLVSICIPTYNSEATLRETLESVVSQTYQNLRIVVVDNASTDGTVAIARSFQDQRLEVVVNEQNIGAEGNFSRCIELGTGDYVAIFHADDIYESEMVARQVEAFESHPEAGAVLTLARTIDSHGCVTGTFSLPTELESRNPLEFDETFRALLEHGNGFLICPSAMLRNELYKEIGRYDYQRFGTASDVDVWLRVLKKAPIVLIREPLMCYRQSTFNGTFQHNFLRTELPDFFRVTEHWLSLPDVGPLVADTTMEKYHFLKLKYGLYGALAWLMRGERGRACELLRGFLAPRVARVALGSRFRFKVYAAGLIVFISTHLGFGPMVARTLIKAKYGRT